MQNHHPSIDDLTLYAAGGLKLSHALCIATHLEYCHECQQCVHKLEQVGSQIFNQGTNDRFPDSNLEELRASVFSQISAQREPAKTSGKAERKLLKRDSSNAPRALKQFVPENLEQLDWKRLSPSIKLATLCNDKDGSQLALSWVKPGGRMPHHSHTGDELTVVLEGSFSDEDGIYSKGDFILRNAKHKHKPVVTKDAPCVCLMVLDSPIEFTGFFTRLLNPAIRRHHYQG